MMAGTGNCGYVKRAQVCLSGLLMVPPPVLAESKCLSLKGSVRIE